MSTYEKSYKGGHPIAGVILGVLGIAAALFLILLTGVIGGAIALILGVVAVLLGIQARKSGRGIGAIIVGAIAIILALAMCMTSFQVMGKVKEDAEKLGAPLVAKYADKPYFGLMGFVMSAASDGENTEELRIQLEAVMEGKQPPAGETTEADAPAEETTTENSGAESDT